MKILSALAMIGWISFVSAADTQKDYPRWLRNATVVYVYTKKGTIMSDVTINDKSTMADVRWHLMQECVVGEGSRYALCPLHNEWWRCGYWAYATDEPKGGEKIKDLMQQYNTQSFWFKRQPRRERSSEDSE
jgi:hypothetical protein